MTEVFDKEINKAVVVNLRLKAKILATVFGIILFMQLFLLTYFYCKTTVFDGLLSIRTAFLGPLLLLSAFLAELYSLRYFNKLLKSHKEVSKNFAYVIVFIEISFPTIIILFAGTIIQQNNIISITQLLNSPPAYIYFLMILLSTLMLDLKLGVFAGIMAAIQFVGVTLFFLLNNRSLHPFEIPNNIVKALLMLICGIVAGLVSKKIKEAVLSSIQSKNDLIHRLDVLVKEKTSEIVLQKEEILQKNKDITDSINYAKRIQYSVLPKTEFIDSIFHSYFILYKPKDIVSGDFYWATRKNGKKIIAAVDCTGHGVPGAFMSMVGSSLLNELVNEKQILTSAEILNSLRERLIKTLHQTGAEGENRDGMDIALCTLDGANLEFSGANNSLYLVRDAVLTEYRGDKQPIGIHSGAEKTFNSKKIVLQKHDCFYIFTDGYADQFGGTKNKKFMYKRLKEELVRVHSFDLSEQKRTLEETFTAWKGENEQIDDILIIGVKM